MQNVGLGNMLQTPLPQLIAQLQTWIPEGRPLRDCQKCESFGSGCSGGCVAASEIFSGELQEKKPDPLCWRFCEESVQAMAEALFWPPEEEGAQEEEQKGG